MLILKNNQKGLAALFIAILVLFIIFGIIINVVTLIFSEQKILRNVIKSSQSYYAAEAGIEDALLYLKNNPWVPAFFYNFNVADAAADINISSIIGGSRVITSQGNNFNQIRKIQTVYAIDAQEISFHYGAQIGDEGMVMGNNSEVRGNVFSNGTITGENGARITNSVIIAGNGNKLQNVDVDGDADVHTCADSDITGTLRYVSGGSKGNCTYGVVVDRGPNEIEGIPLPILQSEINDWKAAATAGGIIIGDKTINGVESLGPVKIQGNLTVNIGKTLKVIGTIYVTGDIVFNNNALVFLDSFYGSLSGIIIADRIIIVENGTQINGSGQPGSYVLILSEMNDIVNPVIDVRNNALGDTVFYANNGLIFLKNGMIAREVTAKKIQIENTAVIQYESGLENANFSSGPGGSWQVKNWKEIE